jgi:RNA polymerase sigma-70 factor (ECF subfamily)
VTFGLVFTSVLAAAQSGAPWAIERLYRELAPAVAGYLRLQGASEPDDLSSDVFLKVFTSLGSFSGGSFSGAEEKFRSWVFTIAHHRLVDERRRSARRPRLADGDPADLPVSTGAGVEEEALREMSEERVRRLCDQLAPDQRDVLRARRPPARVGKATARAASSTTTPVTATDAARQRSA